MRKGWLTSRWKETEAVDARLIARRKRWETIVENGGGTVSEFIRADFETDCPNGLDTKSWGDSPIKIESLLKSNNYKSGSWLEKITDLRWGGWVERNKDSIIHLNPLWYSPLALKLRNAKSFAGALWNADLTAAAEILTGRTFASMASILPHEFIHTRQNHADSVDYSRISGNDLPFENIGEKSKVQQIWKRATRFKKDVSIAISERSSTISAYYARNAEMQARLHEVIALAYAEWQRLPTTKMEFWAALKNLGFTTPDSITHQLQHTTEGVKALQDFKISERIQCLTQNITQTFNRIYDYVQEEDIQEGLWKEKYPLLYGELIEFYGDIPGRERMDMGFNPRFTLEALQELKNIKGEMSSSEARTLAQRVSVPSAAMALNHIIQNYPSDENTEGRANAMLFARELLDREDIRKELFSYEKIIRNHTYSYDSTPPLYEAILAGHTTMTRMLIQAGADPFEKCRVIDIRGKEVCRLGPLLCIGIVEINENHLADPNKLSKQDRKHFQAPENRKRIQDQNQRIRRSLQEILDHGEIDKKHITYEDGDIKLETTFREELQRIGIISIEKRKTTKPAYKEECDLAASPT